MESKTKHRIIGASVVVGLVVILMPFFQHGRGLGKDPQIAKAPSFPEKNLQVSTSQMPSNEEVIQPANTQDEIKTVPDDTISVNQAYHSEPEQKAESTNAIKPNDHQSSNQHEEQSKPVTNSSAASPQASLEPDEDLIPSEPKKEEKKPVLKKQMKTAAKDKHPTPKIQNNGLYDFSHAAWVIQIGSFNEKENAIRLVNRLRAHGYQAFMQEVKTLVGDSTRVFVGPEKKQSKARVIAGKIEANLKLHGIVMSYKPLAL